MRRGDERGCRQGGPLVEVERAKKKKNTRALTSALASRHPTRPARPGVTRPAPPPRAGGRPHRHPTTAVAHRRPGPGACQLRGGSRDAPHSLPAPLSSARTHTPPRMSTLAPPTPVEAAPPPGPGDPGDHKVRTRPRFLNWGGVGRPRGRGREGGGRRGGCCVLFFLLRDSPGS